MKGAALLLSILMLLITMKPCSDEFNSDHMDDLTIEMSHDHSSDNDDSCSSTCVCSCCGTTITLELLKPMDISTKKTISTLVFSEYNSHYRFDFQFNIWQPPQDIS